MSKGARAEFGKGGREKKGGNRKAGKVGGKGGREKGIAAGTAHKQLRLQQHTHILRKVYGFLFTREAFETKTMI